MKLNPSTCYRAVQSRDSRFDGVFFTGVLTTGIYCRPVCTAKLPREENVQFYPSAAAAERRGFRPCLQCRPELAPGNARIDSLGRLASAAAARIEDGALSNMSVAALAEELGVTDRHLRRITESELGVSPIELAQTQRLLLAKRLLTDTHMPVTEIAFASGFSSLRRFNTLFRERYRMNPTDLRKAARPAGSGDSLAFEIAYRPPFDWASLASFLAARAVFGVESIDSQGYSRTVARGTGRGWIAVYPIAGRDRLRVKMSASLSPEVLPLLARVKRLFDLSAHPGKIASHLGTMAAPNPGLRVPGAFDGFEMAVRAILGQQVSVRAATTLMGRLVARFGEPISTPVKALTHVTPTAERVACADSPDLVALGILATRATSILSLARAVTEGKVVLDSTTDPEVAITRLKELPGIGEWTAQYIAMRALNWPDAFPHTDLGIRKALGENRPSRLLEIADAWRPWRAYAAMHLWKSSEGK